MPDEGELQALLVRVDQQYDLPLTLLEQLARQVAAVPPLRARNTPQATMGLFRYKLEKMIGPVSHDQIEVTRLEPMF
jgi:hypothetical protein